MPCVPAGKNECFDGQRVVERPSSYSRLLIEIPNKPIDVKSDNGNCQPYIKLHGSYNWQTTEGRRLMVSGGFKNEQIHQNDFLGGYSLHFEQVTQESPCIIVVIGYGFNDQHINHSIVNALRKNAKLYVIDPRGLEAIRDVFVQIDGGVKFSLMSELQGKLVGLSQRTLTELFGNINQAKQLFSSVFDN